MNMMNVDMRITYTHTHIHRLTYTHKKSYRYDGDLGQKNRKKIR